MEIQKQNDEAIEGEPIFIDTKKFAQSVAAALKDEIANIEIARLELPHNIVIELQSKEFNAKQLLEFSLDAVKMMKYPKKNNRHYIN